MASYPVHYTAVKPDRYTRVQLGIRMLAFIALGLVGLSLGTVFVIAYVALPAFAAARLGRREPEEYLASDGPRVVRLLRWFASVYAWFALVSDSVPLGEDELTVKVEVEPCGRPTPGAALVRVLTGLPSAIVLALLGFIGCFVWLWAAVNVLVRDRVGDTTFAYLAGLQRWSIRLLAYQAALVDGYPPMSFEDAPPHLPAARVAS